MDQYSEEKLAKLTNKKFKRLMGVKREDFNIMVEVVEDAYKERRKKVADQAILNLEKKLLFFFYT